MDYPLPDWLNVSRETHDQLIAYCQQIARWNGAINLVSKSSLPLVWDRHLLDSAQLFRFGQAGPWLDLGSGGGLPGIVMAILGADVTLIESDLRKATFLRETARVLGLTCRVIHDRAEVLPPMGAKTLSARALAPLTNLLDHANYHLDAEGIAIFPKGRTAGDEIEQARQRWRFDCAEHISQTDPQSTVLVVTNIEEI